MDFIKLKDNLLASSTSNIEKVEVNQRHLIDKILARYSAEFTIYRELIQNANDAGASEIQIEFFTSDEFSESRARKISSIVIKNNGRVFTLDDWNRLKKIAEGNPNEQKIGFFGVGFYSLFSICEEPFVISGTTCMGFYWDGNQLYTKSAPYTDNTAGWTSICLHLRESLDILDYDNFGVFLCKSLLFTYSLSTGSFSVDGKVQLRVTKTLSPLESINFPKCKSSSGLFIMKTVDSRIAQLCLEKNYTSVDIDADKSAFSLISGLWRLAQIKFTEKGKEEAALDSKLRQPGLYHAFFKLFQSTSSVKASRKLSDEMERTTKKKPFNEVKVDMIYVNWEQLNAIDSSRSNNQSTIQSVSIKHPILSQLLPFPNKGKVFIGFETHQTSGVGIHFSAPFIPTVERESIDFVDGCLKIWNVELLQISGHLCRIIYEEERKYILKNDTNYLNKSRHLMESFNFQESTPLGLISWTLFQDFLNREDLLVPSSAGFVSIRHLRFVPEEMFSFVRNIPRVPDEISSSCQEFLKKLSLTQQSSINSSISVASVPDVINFELKCRKLSESETLSCLKWWIKILGKSSNTIKSNINQQIINDFSSALLVPSASSSNEQIPLSSVSFYACDELSNLFLSEKAEIKYFPIDCLSPSFSAQFSTSDLSSLLRLQVLDVVEWLGFIYRSSSVKDLLESSPEKSEQFLVFLSKYFSSITENELLQSKICSYLANFRCIPVGEGLLKKPTECYFEDVPRLQTSMNILKFSTETRRNRVNEDMLKCAGVRSHLPLEEIFVNIDNLKWDYCSLLKYLAKIKTELSRSDFDKVRDASIFPDVKDSGLYKLPELYSDNVGHNDLIEILNLKQLKWKDGVFSIKNKESDVGELLSELGFNFIIPWRVLLSAVLKANSRGRNQIYNYFFKNYSNYKDFRPEIVDFPFILTDSETSVLLPTQVFIDPPLNHLGFYLIHPDLLQYAHLLGAKERPNSSMISEQLVKSRFDFDIAVEVFSYCTSISYVFTEKDWNLFRQSAFIPVKSKENESYSYKTFDQVFFPSTSEKSQFSELFDHVDFGSQANAFLKSVGVSDVPQLDVLIKLLLKDPSKLLDQLKPSKYIELMERLSIQWHNFSKTHSNHVKALIASKSFIGTVKTQAGLEKDVKETREVSDDSNYLIYGLYGINEVFLVDDTISYQLFNVPTVPSSLDQFYKVLGCRWLSSIIKSEWKYKGKPDSDGPLVKDVRNLLNDRLELIITSLEGVVEDKYEKIQKGSKNKFANLKIYEVDWIKIYRTCSLNSQENSQSACCFSDYATKYPSIYLARNTENQFDYFDLATVIVTLLCDKRGRLQDSLLVTSLLTTPLSSLKAKGFYIKESSKVINESKYALIDKAPELMTLKPADLLAPQISSQSSLSDSLNDLTLKNDPSNSYDNTPTSQRHPMATPNSPLPPLPSYDQESLEAEAGTEVQSQTRVKKKKWTNDLFEFLKKSTESISLTPKSTSTTTLKTGTAGEGRDEESLRHALDRGIKALRPHGSNNFTSSINFTNEYQNEPAPNNSLLKRELSSYCQIQTSLKIIGTIEEGVSLFANESISTDSFNSFLSDNRAALMSFYNLIIVDLSRKVFKIPTRSSSSIHIFYDSTSSAVAFNRAHSLFFNFAYFFSSKHHEILSTTTTNSSLIEIQRCKAFWFMTFCHELAHNFVSEHDSQHEFYLSSFAETYLPDFLKLFN